MTKRYLPFAVIVDIDGTVADVEHRRHHVSDSRKKNWHAFFEAMVNDPPKEDVIELVTILFNDGYDIIFVSGRPDNYREQTDDWLRSHVPIDRYDLHMRAAGDTRADHVVKREILREIQKEYQIFLSLDDRQSVVDMWRREGITCLQVAPGDFDPVTTADYTGETLLTLLVGPSGAGKTTFATEHYAPDVILSSDVLRERMCGDFQDQSKNDLVFRALHDLVEMRMKHGLFTVVDATNLKRKDRMAFHDLLPRGALMEYVVIDRPLEEKIATGGWRNNVIFKGDVTLVEKHHKTFQSQLKDILAGDHKDYVVVVDERKVS